MKKQSKQKGVKKTVKPAGASSRWSAASRSPRTSINSDAAAIRNLVAEFSKAAAAKNVEGVVSLYSDDALLLLPNTPALRGKKALRKAFTDMFSAPGFSWGGSPTSKVEVSRDGTLAYSTGSYDNTVTGPDGNPVTDHGKWVAVWKKRGRNWKCIVDIVNSDLPLKT